MLKVESAGKVYRTRRGDVVALRDVDLALEPGEFVAVRGASGAGKSTVLFIAGGLLHPDSGSVTVEGQDVYALSAEERARFRAANVGFVFQQFHLVPYLSVRDNVLAASIGMRAADAGERADALLAEFGLSPRSHHKPGALSVGERQRTALARALLNRPRLLLADEPTGNLDRTNAEGVLGHLSSFARSGGAVLLVTHDDAVASAAQRALHLDGGALVDGQ